MPRNDLGEAESVHDFAQAWNNLKAFKVEVDHQPKLIEPARLGHVDKKGGVPEKRTSLNRGAKGGTVKPG